MKRQHARQLRECFDPFNQESRPNEKQLQILQDTEVLFQYVQGGNQSGKSQTGARVASWFFQRNHPYLDIQALWPDEPILILVVGRLNAQVEELWEKKIKPYLSRTEWRENRQGGTLQYAENPHNKSKIIFCTHNNPEEAREKLYSYSAHFVWFDELTSHLGIIEEVQRRVQAKRGRLMLTYTPKIMATAVRKFLETPTPYSKTYRISMLDNPIYAGREDELLSQINLLPPAQRATILEGDWFTGDSAVFAFDHHRHISNPPNYSTLWPHIVSVDPAASGLMGFTLWAAPDKDSYTWWCIKSEYIKGAAPTDLIASVEKKVEGCQVLYRISDTHESWFIKEAAKLKLHYRGIPNKRGRKLELIAHANEALKNGRIKIASTCDDLIAELGQAQWSETADDKIVNASSYHLNDCMQYLVDQMPAFKSQTAEVLTFDQQLHAANKQRKDNEAKRAASAKNPKTVQVRILARRGRMWSR